MEERRRSPVPRLRRDGGQCNDAETLGSGCSGKPSLARPRLGAGCRIQAVFGLEKPCEFDVGGGRKHHFVGTARAKRQFAYPDIRRDRIQIDPHERKGDYIPVYPRGLSAVGRAQANLDKTLSNSLGVGGVIQDQSCANTFSCSVFTLSEVSSPAVVSPTPGRPVVRLTTRTVNGGTSFSRQRSMIGCRNPPIDLHALGIPSASATSL